MDFLKFIKPDIIGYIIITAILIFWLGIYLGLTVGIYFTVKTYTDYKKLKKQNKTQEAIQ